MQKTAIIIINWNGWKDSIECLGSFEWPVEDAHFFILDNLSSDDSVMRLEKWLGDRGIRYRSGRPEDLAGLEAGDHEVTLVRNPLNQGFAGGNNVILRHLLNTGRYPFAWLLNNDTVVKKDSLSQLIRYMESHPSMAFCGSVLLDYYRPELIQCCSVTYYKYLGVSKLYLKDKLWEGTGSLLPPNDPSTMFQIGASLLVDMDKIRHTGLMDETFFMYSEEADWQIRAASRGYTNGWAPESIVYHKGNVSTSGKKHIFFYHYNRSAIILTRKNFGILPAFSATIALTGITVIRSRLAGKAMWFGLKGLVAGWKAPIARSSY
ncbi:MAG TPA: glycosyltransferase family 2 protein [Puia sp.]|jgi:GT2 family glycosyltransferase|nr:glycosyltransferase family 2 protein [Puia sp.]